jgi:mono/diheme cytochrome c family protein
MNAVPSRDDIERVILQGIPGTAMPSFAGLPAEQRRELAEQVERFRHDGARERITEQLHENQGATDEAEVQRLFATLTTPGEVLRAPAMGHDDPRAVRRGKELYFKTGCQACHGADGTGAADTPLSDERGWPVTARDLARDPMKGGDDPQSLYRRIRLGMPGTPHPACPNLTDEELANLVQFCRSLSQEPKRALTNYQRMRRAARKL